MNGPVDPAGAGWSPAGAGWSPGPAERFQPVPGAQLVDAWRARGRAGQGIEVVAPEGTPVHAVAGGVVLEVVAEGSDGRVAVRGEDGRRYEYRRLGSGSVTVAPGQPVAAGSIIGTVGPADAQLPAGGQDPAAGEPTHLHLTVTGPDGEPLDPYQLLLGLPDPNELGYGPSGQDVDPDETDRQTPA